MGSILRYNIQNWRFNDSLVRADHIPFLKQVPKKEAEKFYQHYAKAFNSKNKTKGLSELIVLQKYVSDRYIELSSETDRQLKELLEEEFDECSHRKEILNLLISELGKNALLVPDIDLGRSLKGLKADEECEERGLLWGEFIQLKSFCKNHYLTIEGMPSYFNTLNSIGYERLMELNNELTKYKFQSDLLKEILDNYFIYHESRIKDTLSGFIKDLTSESGRKQLKGFTKEDIEKKLNDEEVLKSIEGKRKYWRQSGKNKGSIILAQLALYMIYIVFETDESSISIRTMEDRLKEILPSELLPN